MTGIGCILIILQLNGRAAILHLSGAMSFGATNEMMRRIVWVLSMVYERRRDSRPELKQSGRQLLT